MRRSPRLIDRTHSSSREPDPAISEGVCSIIFSAPRTEVKELHVLRDILMHKYGREFSITVMENHDGRVSERVVRKAYGVAWTSPNTPSSDDNIDDGSDGDVKQTAASTNSPPAYRPNTAAEPGPTLPAIPPNDIDGPDNKKSKSEDAAISDEFEALNRRLAALKKK
ncbi:regulator of Vps4 activity in the MVB pathway-domain-containing protein [Armillaria mellea]|nr:regulator of Vps4 activity in the MVB pathway-domain-containing protein [Armillaria mellea]